MRRRPIRAHSLLGATTINRRLTEKKRSWSHGVNGDRSFSSEIVIQPCTKKEWKGFRRFTTVNILLKVKIWVKNRWH